MAVASVATVGIRPAAVELEFRRAVDSDIPAINSAFLRGMRESSYTHGLPSETFFSVARQAWAGIRRDFLTTIAHPKGEPDEIAAYVVHAEFTQDAGKALAWIYVAKDWRKLGVGRSLLAHVGVVPGERFAVLFATPQKLALARSKGYQPAFLPYLSWRWLDSTSQPPPLEPGVLG